MMFTIIFAVTTMICCGLVHGGRSDESSKIVQDLVYVRSGYFDNRKQIDKGYKENDFIQLWFIPVNVPIFGAKLVMLFIEAKYGTTIRIQLLVVSSDEVNVVEMTPYNFTDPSLYKPGEFPLKDLDNLTLAQLHTDPDCVSTYDLVRRGVFMLDWPDCEVTVDGKHPLYAATMTCDEIYAVAPVGAIEAEGHSLYDVNRKGEKYPLINAPDNYVGPCD